MPGQRAAEGFSDQTRLQECTEDSPVELRYARLMAIGAGAALIGSLVWAAGIVANESPGVDALTMPGFAATVAGIGAMTVGSALHHRQGQ